MKRKNSANLLRRERFRRSGISGRIAFILATWFGVGLFPFAPGTFGTMGAVPLALVLGNCPVAFKITFFLFFVAIAIWASGHAESLLGKNDPSEVVIDEVAGFLAATILLRFSWPDMGIAFLVFRIFDIAKPFPVRFLERRLNGGFGIVMDDIAAGCYTLGTMTIMHLFLL